MFMLSLELRVEHLSLDLHAFVESLQAHTSRQFASETNLLCACLFSVQEENGNP